MGFLDGRIAIVTGADGRLGRAFADGLAAEGAAVAAFDTGDVGRRADCERIVAGTVARLGGIDILVNAAERRRRTPVADPWEKALADFNDIVGGNVTGAMMMSRLCAARMLARGGGDIVHVSAAFVLPARDGAELPADSDIYVASKWALNGMTDYGTQMLERFNIRVNAIAPDVRCTDDAAIGRLLIELLRDGRSGENIGVWPGQPVVLGPRKRADVRIRERADFTGRPLTIYGPPPWDDAEPTV